MSRLAQIAQLVEDYASDSAMEESEYAFDKGYELGADEVKDTISVFIDAYLSPCPLVFTPNSLRELQEFSEMNTNNAIMVQMATLNYLRMKLKATIE